MKCPHCNHEFPLTWKRYWQSPTGRHVCPSCLQQSRFRLTVVSWLRMFVGISFGGIPFGWLFHIWFGGQWWLAGWTLGGLLTGIPIDKYIDERLRKLEKCETDK